MSFFDLWQQSFMQNALAACLLVSIACGVIGALVVVNRLVFMAGGIAHTAYGGVGLAIFSGLPVLPIAGAFTALASLFLGALTRTRRERTDTLIGVIWAGGMAFGIILINLTPGYNVGLMSYLFGSLLTVPTHDLWLMLVIDVVIVGLTLFFYRELLSFSFDADFAQSRGVAVRAIYFMLLIMVAEAVVMMIQVVGLILVIALLTLPPYLADRHTKTLAGLIIASGLWSFVFCIVGLWAAYQFDLSSGASIIAAACAIYLLYLGIESVWRGFARVRATA